MVNNLGTATELELSAFVYALMPVLRAHGCSPKRIYVGSFMTALDMHGVSVTALDLSLDADLLRLLDCPSSAPAWKPSLATSKSLAPPIEDEKFVSITDTVFVECPKFSSMIYHICESLVSAEPKLTELDSRCGDGDCGFTVKAAAQSVMANLKDKVHYESTGASNLVYPVYDSIKFANTCTFLADNTSATMGGTLGAIMELLLRAMSNHYRSSGQTEVCLADALEAGISAISFYGGAKVGMRTMLDALQPAAEALRGMIIEHMLLLFFTVIFIRRKSEFSSGSSKGWGSPDSNDDWFGRKIKLCESRCYCWGRGPRGSCSQNCIRSCCEFPLSSRTLKAMKRKDIKTRSQKTPL